MGFAECNASFCRVVWSSPYVKKDSTALSENSVRTIVIQDSNTIVKIIITEKSFSNREIFFVNKSVVQLGLWVRAPAHPAVNRKNGNACPRAGYFIGSVENLFYLPNSTRYGTVPFNFITPQTSRAN
jgi:hypothetical protein